jgi:hypothetical protein
MEMPRDPKMTPGPTGRPINPGHPVTKQSIPSDRQAAGGVGSVTKGEGRGVRTTSGELNHFGGKYGGKVAGHAADKYDWKK